MSLRVILVTCVLPAAVLAACGTGDRERDVAAVTERFHAALADRDGVAACAELSEETASKLESQEERPCEQAILELDLPGRGNVAVTHVDVLAGFAELADGAAAFLTEGPDGWRIAAAGCRETAPDQPYDCVLES